MGRLDFDISCIMLQATPFCNLDCSYCYLPDRNNKHSMDAEYIDLLLEKIINSEKSSDDIEVWWHHGEPLVAGVEYYRRIMKCINEKSRKNIFFGIQTNGYTLSKDWIELFREFDVNISISIDGPKYLHDKNRVLRNGRGTFDQILSNLKLMQAHDVPFQLKMVLTKDHLSQVGQIFEFFESNDFRSLSFIPEEIEGVHANTSLQGRAKDYRSFWETLYWFDKVEGIVCSVFTNSTRWQQ